MTTITSRKNDAVKNLCHLAGDGSVRREQGLCLVEGAKLCFDLEERAVFHQLWVTGEVLAKYDQEITSFGSGSGCEIVMTSQSVYEKLSYFLSGDGMIGVAEIPERELPNDGTPVVVLCDIQNPGNVGGLIRTAAALGFGGAVLCGACADPFSPKAIRGSMGSSLLVPCIRAENPSFLRGRGYTLIAATLDPSAVAVTGIPRKQPSALMIGNEGHGFSPEMIALADMTVYIPITDKAESLNAAAAAAIAMWEIVR